MHQAFHFERLPVAVAEGIVVGIEKVAVRAFERVTAKRLADGDRKLRAVARLLQSASNYVDARLNKGPKIRNQQVASSSLAVSSSSPLQLRRQSHQTLGNRRDVPWRMRSTP